jgi:WD40 repeat protein
LGLASTLLAVFWTYSLRQTNQQTIARADQTAVLATSKLETRYDQALLLFVTANQISDNESTRKALSDTINANKKLKTVMYGHSGIVSSVAFREDGNLLASGSYDQTVRLWDPLSAEVTATESKGHTGIVRGVAFAPNADKILASASFDKTIDLWAPTKNDSRKYERKSTLTGHTDSVRSVAFSKTGLLASGSDDNTVRLWNLGAGTSRMLKGHTDDVYAVAFSPDGKRLASASKDNTIRLWDISKNPTSSIELTGHEGTVSSVAFSPDGKTLASGSYDQTIRLWTLDSAYKPIGAVRILNGHEGDVDSVTFNRDGTKLASSGMDKKVRLWDLMEPEPIAEELEGHSGIVLSVAFSPDGATLASGSMEQSVRLWTVNSSADEIDKSDSAGLRARACSIVKRNLTPDEWEEFFGSLVQQPSCPELPVGK